MYKSKVIRFHTLIGIFLVFLATISFGQGTWVEGYTRKDGTYVKGHYKKAKSTKKKPSKKKTLEDDPHAFDRVISTDQDSSTSKKKPSKEGALKDDPHAFDRPIFPENEVRGAHSPSSHSKKAKGGIFVKSSKNQKIKPGDRLISIKDSTGKSFPIHSEADFNAFLKSHPHATRATVRLERGGSYHTLVIKNIAQTFKF